MILILRVSEDKNFVHMKAKGQEKEKANYMIGPVYMQVGDPR